MSEQWVAAWIKQKGASRGSTANTDARIVGQNPTGYEGSDARISEKHDEPVNTVAGRRARKRKEPCSNLEDNPTNLVVPDLDDIAKMEKKKRMELPKQLEDRYKWLEKKFKVLENTDYHYGIDAKELSLVPDLVLPPKFKMSKFENYNGTSYSEAHITMFCRRMTGYANIAPDRITLQNMKKKPNESFRQYAQRWREVATQVQPSLLEKETTMLFINTLKAPFINHMLGSATKSFSDIVMSSKMIENAIRCGKIKAGESTKRSALKKRENELNNVNTYNRGYSKPIIVNKPRTVTASHQGPPRQESNTRQNTEKLHFTPIPMTYRKLYQSLFDAHVVSPFYLKLMQPPYPKWYDANAQCEYHVGIRRHSIENCTAFKKLVEKLIKIGIIKFDDPSGAENPLPNHADKGVNAIVENTGKKIKKNIAEVKTPLREVWKKMGHEIQKCNEFKALVQGLMDNKELEFFEYTEGPEGMFRNRSINAISEEGVGRENLSGIRPYEPGNVLNNWTAEEIPIVFRTDSDDMSDAASDPESPFERDMCLEGSQDFEDDRDSEETKRDLIELLQEFKYVFEWSYQDIPGLSTDIVVHRLPIKEECKPVQQKLQRMRPDVVIKIKEEVKKQFDAGFLQVVKYSEWVANIVSVPKKDGKVRMCVDYRDLNKASPKDNFPLPHIDTLVDNTASYSLFSFMDGFSGYNQIKIHPEDMEKTTFVTLWGIFCYKEIEVYVDDMIAKSRTEKEYVQVLRKLFLSERGIEIDPDKVKAIQELPPPRTQKEVRCFLGRLNYIARFISQLTEKCDPIFHLFKKHNPGKTLQKIVLENYGASNAVGNGIGAVLTSPSGDRYPFTCKLDFDCTNNMEEYEACIIGIRVAIEHRIKVLEVYGDSTLVIYQLKVSMIIVNKQEDVKPIQMSIYEAPAHCYNINEKEEKDDHFWYHDILRYVKNREYSDQAIENDKRTLRRLTSDYVLDGEILYKRRKDQVLLRCVDAVEAKKILEEVHEGVYGTYANGFIMARQIMRFRYCWSTMEGDCINYAKKCHKCQIYGDNIHVPPSPLHVMTSPWFFSMWGMDIIKPISPKAFNEHRFIFVVIYYFTKWVEAASYANVTKSSVSKFLKCEIICWYGMPERIISYNALNLKNSTIAEHEKLPFALYAYRTSVRTSTGATPFSLVYGMEAVLPIEVEIPSLRVLSELKLDEAKWIQSRYDQLNLIEEKRLKTIHHGQMYQKRMMRAYNKKVRPRKFHEGDLVLKKILPLQKDFKGKWMPNWEGPYVVKKVFSRGVLILTEMDGKNLPNPVNSNSIKKYFT
ncbi:RNA-directed DNA polymerase (Reverse transcriptase), Ribonuclease H [Gossypium australe]|uniref:RNA-directed DNA polymerase (Reverse transcriptase), Ribonuclease H n=1 Tax=Gossypium australe TaxID=47621 RepID=A0A5B6UT08_9ROSI|nr:RNA-directed DNA polymerase (Reverse transcriptase), Ribonuclease H [Gossypium australe]